MTVPSSSSISHDVLPYIPSLEAHKLVLKIVSGFVTVEQVYRSEAYGKKQKQGMKCPRYPIGQKCLLWEKWLGIFGPQQLLSRDLRKMLVASQKRCYLCYRCIQSFRG